MYDKRIGSITASNCGVTPNLNYYGNKTRVEFYGNCLKQDKIIFNHEKVGNIFVVYEIIRVISKYSSNDNYPALENALFRAVSLTKNADFNKCKYCKYVIGFDRRSGFSHPSGGGGQNVIILGVDMSSSTKIDNKKKIFWFWVKRQHKG